MLQIVGLFSYFAGSSETCPIVFESRRKFSLPLKPLAVLANKSPSKTGLSERVQLCTLSCALHFLVVGGEVGLKERCLETSHRRMRRVEA